MLQIKSACRSIIWLALAFIMTCFIFSACQADTATPLPASSNDIQTITEQNGAFTPPDTLPADSQAPLPTAAPAVSPTPTLSPAAAPTVSPTTAPTVSPTTAPTAKPTVKPTTKPKPTITPTPVPTEAPVFDPVHLPGVPGNWPASSTQQERINTFISLVNQVRLAEGVPALSAGNNKMREAAAIRAAEISVLFSHSRPTDRQEYSSFADLLELMTISYRLAGENIAYVNTPEAAMTAFMNSAGHRANILKANYTTIAIGVYTDASGRDYWAQIFVG